MIRVAVDARRQRDNGIARITRLLVIALQQLPVELVLLGPVESLWSQFPHAELIDYDAPLLSGRDFNDLDELLLGLEVDLFLAPQFYNSTRTTCPQIRVLHDMFPIDHHASRPTIESVEDTFGEGEVSALRAALLGNEDVSRSDLAARLYRAFYDASVAKSAVLLTVSEQSLAGLTEAYPDDTEKMSLLPLFPDPKVISPRPEDFLLRPTDALHVSKFEPRKNQLKLLAAWHLLWEVDPSFKACLVGSPSSLYVSYTAELMSAIERGQREGWLTHRTAIADSELSLLYGTSKVVCVTSRAEGFGLPALEAMANGCIVVALRGTAVDEVCGPLVAHAEDSPESIAETLSRLLNQPEQASLLSQSSRMRAEGYTVVETMRVLARSISRALGRALDS